MRSRGRHAWALVAVIHSSGIALVPRFARAQADPARATAEDHTRRAADLKVAGDRAMETLRYSDAIDAYTKAYELSHETALLYNRGRALQLLGRFPEALAELERFERESSPELLARVPTLPKLLAEVRAHVATLRVTCNVDGARLLLRDTIVGTTPLTSPLRTNTGTGTLEVTADGYLPFRQELALTPGSIAEVVVTLAPRAAAGVLAVASTSPASRVFIDGQPFGLAPVDAPLAAGAHRVLLKTDGYLDIDTSTTVSAGAKTELSLHPEKKTGILGQWWFWGGVGVVAVTAGVIIYALVKERPADTGTFGPGRASAPLVSF
jgi:hypothetical protein